MKRILPFITIALLICLSSATFAQIRKIPAEVTNAFADKYPNARDVEWKDKLTSVNVNFTLDSGSYLANFSNEGEWQNTEQEIDQTSLPENISESFSKSKYADWEVLKAHKIEMAGDAVQYRIEIGKGDIKKRNLYYNSKGRLLKDPLTI